MLSRGTRTGAIVGVVAAAVVLLLIPAGALATVSAASSPPPQSWSSSGQAWKNWSSNGSYYSSQGHWTASWSETVTATNTSANITQLEEVSHHTLHGSLVSCWPNCTSPRATSSYNATFDARATAFLNLTSHSSVYVNGSPASALGMINDSARSSATLNSSYVFASKNWSAWGMNFSALRITNNVSGMESSHASVAFSPSLGLIPWNLSANMSWNASSAYAATGGWAAAFSDNFTSSGGSSTLRHWAANGSVIRNGTDSVIGRTLAPTSGANNTTVQRILLLVGGGFGLDDELFPIVIGSDLFNNATRNWSLVGDSAGRTAEGALAVLVAEHHGATPSAGGGSSSGGSTGTPPSGGGSGGGTTTTSPPSPSSSAPSVPSPPSHSARLDPALPAGGALGPSPAGGVPGWAWAALGVALVAGLGAGSVWLRFRGRPGR